MIAGECQTLECRKIQVAFLAAVFVFNVAIFAQSTVLNSDPFSLALVRKLAAD